MEKLVPSRGRRFSKTVMLWAFGDRQSLTGFHAFGSRIQMQYTMLNIQFIGSVHPLRLNPCQFISEKYPHVLE